MLEIKEGDRYWKHGDHSHVWVVDAVLQRPGRGATFVVLVSEDGLRAEDVELSHLQDREQFTPVS